MHGLLLIGQGSVDWPLYSVWLTPIWLIGVGALLGLAVLLVLWGISFVVARRVAVEVPLGVHEGPLWPIFIVTVLLAAFAILGYPIASQPNELLSGIVRLPLAGPQAPIDIEIPAPPDGKAPTDPFDAPLHEVPVDFRRDEVRQITFESDGRLLVTPTEDVGLTSTGTINLEPGSVYTWNRSNASGSPFTAEANQVTKLYVRQMSGDEVNLRITLDTAPANADHLVSTYFTAAGVVGLFLIYFLHRTFLPRLTAIALSTVKTEMAQLLFWIIVVVGAFCLVLFQYIPYYTLGDDIIMYKNSCLPLILILAIGQGVWAASQSISEEIEGRTALTVLSKPIARWQFIVGKFTGILWTVAVVIILLGIVFLIVLAYKPIYDARESSRPEPIWQQTNIEVIRVVPGLVLAFFEAAIMSAISVAISTRLPMLANFTISGTIYIVGRIMPLLVQSSIVAEQFEPVVFVGRFLAVVLPMLEWFNIQAGIAGGQAVPLAYLGTAMLYCVLYCLGAMLLSLVLFEDRDLA